MIRALALMVPIALGAALRAQSVVGSEDLEVHLARAKAVVGRFIEDGADLVLTSDDRYDCVALVGRVDAAHSTIDLDLTHESGMSGGGLVFGSRESSSAPEFAQMVRFDGEGELLHGAFARGQFEADGRIVLSRPIPRGTRVRLTLSLDAERRRMDVAIDGVTVGRDLPLHGARGAVFVEGSMGRVRFHAASARGDRAPAQPVWPDAFAVESERFILHAAGGWFALPRDGGPAMRLDSCDTMLHAETAIDGARIVAGAIELGGGARFVGRSLGRFDAVALARDADGTLLALDQCEARIVAVPGQGDDLPLRLVFPRRDSVRTLPPTSALVLDEDGRMVGESSADGTVTGLAPETRYRLRLPPQCRTWPRDLAFRSIPFVSPPPQGSMRTRRLDIVVGLFGNVGAEDDDLADLPRASDYDFERLEDEIRVTCTWYFLHSDCRLWLRPHFVRRAEPTTVRALSSTGEQDGEPPRALLEQLASAAGLPLASVAGFCVVMDAKSRAGKDRPWQQLGGGGGLTLGAHGTGYGRSWFCVPRAKGMVSWLACHELHHQLDALFEISGMPEYPFNHFAPSLHNVAFFGEHWEGNAWILEQWPAHRFDALRFGEDVLVADVDGDGLPDADPRLPFDEARFGSDPARTDTDGDGLDDRAEARLGRWLCDSGFESQLGPPLTPDPRHADTDGDGIEDSDDQLPLLPFEPRLRLGTPTHLREVDDPRLHVDVSLVLREGMLEVRSTCADPTTLQVQVMLDAEADGWFAGADNLRIRAQGDSARVVEVFDASSTTAWPHADPLRARGMAIAAAVEESTAVLKIPLPASAQQGAAIGLSIAYRSRLLGEDDPRWLSLFEPHRLVRFTLDLDGPERARR